VEIVNSEDKLLLCYVRGHELLVAWGGTRPADVKMVARAANYAPQARCHIDIAKRARSSSAQLHPRSEGKSGP